MPPVPALATLSSAGILTEPNQVADYLFKCFLASENSQSINYSIQSLPYLVEQSTGRVQELPELVNQALQGLYGAYFESVTSQVVLKEYEPEPEKLVLSIKMVLSIDGNMYDLSRLVEKISGQPKFIQQII